jgi:hypothetical protein
MGMREEKRPGRVVFPGRRADEQPYSSAPARPAMGLAASESRRQVATGLAASESRRQVTCSPSSH